MRKSIIIFLLFIATYTTAYSQIFTYTSTELYVNTFDGNGYVLKPVKQNITLDFNDNLIILDSLEVFNVNNVDRTKTLNYHLLKCYCYDSSGAYRTIELYMYSNSMYVKIYYNRIIYKYKIRYK